MIVCNVSVDKSLSPEEAATAAEAQALEQIHSHMDGKIGLCAEIARSLKQPREDQHSFKSDFHRANYIAQSFGDRMEVLLNLPVKDLYVLRYGHNSR